MSFNLFTYYNQDKEYTSLKVSLCPMGKVYPLVNHLSLSTHRIIICCQHFLEFYAKRIAWCILFKREVWRLSLCLVNLRFIYVILCISNVFLFVPEIC